jgi:hypothetical protein
MASLPDDALIHIAETLVWVEGIILWYDKQYFRIRS